MNSLNTHRIERLHSYILVKANRVDQAIKKRIETLYNRRKRNEGFTTKEVLEIRGLYNELIIG